MSILGREQTCGFGRIVYDSGMVYNPQGWCQSQQNFQLLPYGFLICESVQNPLLYSAKVMFLICETAIKNQPPPDRVAMADEGKESDDEDEL